MIDLHLHSSYSDGTYSPKMLVEAACEAGLKAIALTDHDTIEGNNQFLMHAAENDITALAGVEISAEYINHHVQKRGAIELHILGYFPEWSPKTEEALAPLADLRHNRNIRNPKIIKKLNSLGCEITLEEVNQYAANNVVGRPHIAALLLKKGYVSSIEQAFSRYLSNHAPAFVAKKRFSVYQALSMIINAGGVPVLAHPRMSRIHSDSATSIMIGDLKKLGLAGIEVHCSSHQASDVKRFTNIAQIHNLFVTGGSDFHGENKPDIKIGRGFGNVNVPDSCMESIISAIKTSNTKPID